MKARRKAIIWCVLAGVILTPVLLFVWAFARATDQITPFDNRPFDAAAWRLVTKETDYERRAEMAHDLIRHHLKVGMSKNEIKAMLGPPDKTWDTRFRGEAAEVYEYNMGRAPFDFQNYVFRLIFDGQGHYRETDITRD